MSDEEEVSGSESEEGDQWYKIDKPPTTLLIYSNFDKEILLQIKKVTSNLRDLGIEPIELCNPSHDAIKARIEATLKDDVSGIIVIAMSVRNPTSGKCQAVVNDTLTSFQTDRLAGIPKVIMVQCCKEPQNEQDCEGFKLTSPDIMVATADDREPHSKQFIVDITTALNNSKNIYKDLQDVCMEVARERNYFDQESLLEIRSTMSKQLCIIPHSVPSQPNDNIDEEFTASCVLF